jgi:hypothetical protein
MAFFEKFAEDLKQKWLQYYEKKSLLDDTAHERSKHGSYAGWR